MLLLFRVAKAGLLILTAVIDCHDREVIGYELSLRGRAKEAERAIATCSEWCSTECPHQALGYLSPNQFRLNNSTK